MNFEIDIKIDETALDVECLDQPSLMMQYGKNLAEAERALSTAKMQNDMVRAELDREIRKNPEKYGISKITETAIAGAISTAPGYNDFEKHVIDAAYEVKVARAAVDAVQQKKDMLEALIRLHGQQYFAGPKVPRDLHQEWVGKQQNQKSNKAVAERLIRRNK